MNIEEQQALPESMDYGAWDELEEMIETKDYWDSLMPEPFRADFAGTGRAGPGDRSRRSETGEVHWHSCRM